MSDELYHYGVKGMKWGVRRTPAQLGHTGKRKKKSNNNIDREEAKRIVKKAIPKLAVAAVSATAIATGAAYAAPVINTAGNLVIDRHSEIAERGKKWYKKNFGN